MLEVHVPKRCEGSSPFPRTTSFATYNSCMNLWAQAATEIFEEAATADYWESTWFRDTEPGGSFLGTLDQLTAEQASRPPAVGRNTIVAHARHALAYIEMGVANVKGEEPRVDWAETWAVQQMNETDWAVLRQRFREKSDEWRALVMANETWEDADWMKGTIAFVAHVAYHLGAVRQLAAYLVRHA